MTPQKMEILRMRVQSEVELPYRKVNCFYCGLHSCVAWPAVHCTSYKLYCRYYYHDFQC